MVAVLINLVSDEEMAGHVDKGLVVLVVYLKVSDVRVEEADEGESK